jgi:hypothetical protein
MANDGHNRNRRKVGFEVLGIADREVPTRHVGFREASTNKAAVVRDGAEAEGRGLRTQVVPTAGGDIFGPRRPHRGFVLE